MTKAKPKAPKRRLPKAGRKGREQDFLEDWKRLNPDPPRLPDELVRPPGDRK